MAEVAIIAIVVILLAIIIGKANHSDALIWRLLFVFSLTVCVSVGLLYILNEKPKLSAQTIEKDSKMIIDADTSHTVNFNQITMEEASCDTVGQDTISYDHLTQIQCINMMPAIAKTIAEHAIFDSS